MPWFATCLIVAVFSGRQQPLMIRPSFTLTADTHPFIAATAVSRIVSRANNMADTHQGSTATLKMSVNLVMAISMTVTTTT